MRLHRFHGGLKLAGHKAESTVEPIRTCPPPARLVVPLLQHAGAPAEPCVEVGQRVRRGERIGQVRNARGSDVHAPLAGRVLAVEPRPLPVPPGTNVTHVLIAPDGDDDAMLLPVLDWRAATPEQLRARAHEAGIAGLGGAGFPTAEKLAIGPEAGITLIVNGAECEPWIACDDALLRARADEVVRGARVLARCIDAIRILLAVEDVMAEALAACCSAAAEHGEGAIEVVTVPTVYPEGGERQLIRVLTGLEVPRGGLPRDIGVLVHNVGTAAALWRAVAHGEALTTRIVTVTGRGVRRPGNFEVPFGTPVAHLIEQAGGYAEQATRLLLGGPMMGTALPHDDFPIAKTSNCVLVLIAEDVHGTTAGERAPELPCIRCGECAQVCPANLLPQQLLWHVRAENWARAEADGVFDCIECGCCDLVCPSHIPLVQHYRYAKTELRARAREAVDADAARERYEARQRRLAREEAERTEQLAARRTAAATPDAVAAAIERAKAARAKTNRQGPGPDGRE